MGIQQFAQLFKSRLHSGRDTNAHVLLFDMNCMIYWALGDLPGLKEHIQVDLVGDKVKLWSSTDEFCPTMYMAIVTLLAEQIDANKEAMAVYVAFDGVPAVMKMIEQRRRRFAGRTRVIGITNEELFNSAVMVPSSKFMIECYNYVKDNLPNVIKNRSVQIEFNGPHYGGEGEYKIMLAIKKYIVSNSSGKPFNAYVYSNDNDINVLNMMISSQFSSGLTAYKKVNLTMVNYKLNIPVDELRNVIIKSVPGTSGESDKVDTFLFLTMFLGNDFLPKISTLGTGQMFDLMCSCLDQNETTNPFFTRGELNGYSNVVMKWENISTFLYQVSKRVTTDNSYNQDKTIGITNHNFIANDPASMTKALVASSIQFLSMTKTICDVYLSLTQLAYTALKPNEMVVPENWYDFGVYAPGAYQMKVIADFIGKDVNGHGLKHIMKAYQASVFRDSPMAVEHLVVTQFMPTTHSELQAAFVIPYRYQRPEVVATYGPRILDIKSPESRTLVTNPTEASNHYNVFYPGALMVLVNYFRKS